MRHATRFPLGAILFAATLGACVDQPTGSAPSLSPTAPSRTTVPAAVATPDLVRQLAAARGVVALPPRVRVRPALARLGQALAFDPILSGNRNISCATCHLPAFATGDGKSLSVGEGGSGFGPPRAHPQGTFIARNAPSLFNLAAMRQLFWDGRIERDAHGVVHTPAGAQLTPAMASTFEFGPSSALGMFPVTNRDEMRGHTATANAENELALIPDTDLPGVWSALMRRLGAVPEYRAMFRAAYPGTEFEDMTFAHASNAIGGFFADQFTFDNSPWDQFLAGNNSALTQRQLDGAQTFLTLKCSICHTGAAFSDDKFHDVAVAQVGPGEGDGASAFDDFGRMRVTGLASDKYLFRTTPLRNVELTGPYGHDGSITSLHDFVEHYSESDLKLQAYNPLQLEPALRSTFRPTITDVLAQRDTLLKGVVLTPVLVDKLMDYMLALTDDAARDLSRAVPHRVPSGLPVLPPRH